MWPSDVIWRQSSGSTLAYVMTWCLAAPSHYLNQFWFLICEVLRYLPESKFANGAWASILYDELENHTFRISATPPWDQRVNPLNSNLGMSPANERWRCIVTSLLIGWAHTRTTWRLHRTVGHPLSFVNKLKGVMNIWNRSQFITINCLRFHLKGFLYCLNMYTCLPLL